MNDQENLDEKDIGLWFSIITTYSLRGLFPIVIFWTLKFTRKHFELTACSSYMIAALLACATIVYWQIKRNTNTSIVFLSILLMGFAVRMLWYLNMTSLPSSDFLTMYLSGADVLEGNYSGFHGTAYFARFPHMTPTVIYFGFIRKIFADPLNAVRLINLGLSMVNMVLVYSLAKAICKKSNQSLWIMFLVAFYPPMIYYNNVFAAENLAMPLLLASVRWYLRGLDEHKLGDLVYSGIWLSLAHLFRPVGYVMLPAYVLYGLVYYKGLLEKKLLLPWTVIATAVIPYTCVAFLLVHLGITEYPLWHGTEPFSVSVLKGTNLSSGGRWNAEDASVFDSFNRDYASVDAESKRLIKGRLTQTPIQQLAQFYARKFGAQWMEGDCGGAFWSEAGHYDEKALRFAAENHSAARMFISLDREAIVYNQVFVIGLYVLMYAGLFRKGSKENPRIVFLYIVFCGFALFHLMIESQARYAYMASWLFPLLALSPFAVGQKKCSRGIFLRW